MFMIKMPVACLVMVLYAYYYYKKSIRLHTRASAIFEYMLLCLMVNLIADAVTEYTVNHRDVVPESFNYIWHVVFILSILVFVFLMYFYLLTYVEGGIHKGKDAERRAAGVVALICVIGILAAPIEYIDTEYGSYSLGPKAYVLYAGALYTMAMMLRNLLLYWKVIPKEKCETVRNSMLIFIVFAVAQMIFPYILVTSVGMSMMVLGFLFSSEDSNKYIDEKTGYYNKLGCQEILQEYILTKKSFILRGYLYIGNQRSIDAAMDSAGRQMAKADGCKTCVIADNMIAFLMEKEDSESVAWPLECREQTDGVREFVIKIAGDKWDNEEKILRQLSEFREKNEEAIMYRDNMTGIFNRNAYEKDIASHEQSGWPVWYILADINHLKETNDLYGHSAGDDLIRRMASLMSEVFSHDACVYRIGGDEFVAVYFGDKGDEKLKELYEAQRRQNESAGIQLDFAVGYAKYRRGEETWGDLGRRADYNMYQHKMSQKSGLEEGMRGGVISPEARKARDPYREEKGTGV